MKKFFIFAICLIFAKLGTCQNVNFDEYFENASLRVDYSHAGNKDSATVFFENLKKETFWSASKKNLIDPFNYGEYLIFVYDSASQKLIYSHGYSTLFWEWRTTAEAKVLKRSAYQTVHIPFPKKTIYLEIKERDKSQKLSTIFKLYVNPTNYFISKELPPKYEVKKIVNNGDHNKKVDLLILPDGYTQQEMQKFRKDAEKFANYILNAQPFKENKQKFNVWAIEIPSEETGTDIPGENLWKKTAFNSTFYTFDSERYLTTFDMKRLNDIAALVPHDQIILLVNHNKYGGGGVYNHFCITSTDNEKSDFIVLHEFGHSFASLADEYYTSSTSYEEYYDLKAEPYEPNITTLINFEIKWKAMLAKNVAIPTIPTTENKEEVGVFEGGGYVAKGVYRPRQECTMKSARYDYFCPVCKQAIIKMIEYYTE